ncbi:uncharacterized protein LOC132300500 [Cornus florida]|uniref:uncharacterized protein LOC132300500 n=1 Tax=Cornus florida TaxID=4283 RepID=UPI00289A232B|nr:uncharacterized protein LOC132300500 [Cornus florida]
MENDFDSDTCLGSKRRISELDSEIEGGTQRIVDEQPSDFLSLEQPSSAIGSSTKDDEESLRSSSDFASESCNGLPKKAKCSSSDESETSAAVQEKQETVHDVLALVSEGVKVNQEIDEDNLGTVNDVVSKVNGHEGRLVNEKDRDLGKCELGFSGTRELDEVHKSSSSSSCVFTASEDQMDSVVRHCNTGLVTSCTAFDENESELFLRNKEKQSFVNEKDIDLARSELGFSGTQELDEVQKSSSSRSSWVFTAVEDQMDFVVHDSNEGLVTSCTAFDENESELFLRNKEQCLVNETDRDLARSEMGFSGTQELDEVQKSSVTRSSCVFTAIEDQMDSAVENSNKGLVTSCTAFDEIDFELFLRNKEKQCLVEPEVEILSDAKNHVLKPTDSESSRTVVDVTMRIKEDFEHSLNEEPGTEKIADTDEKGKSCQETQQIGQNEKLAGLNGIGGALNRSLKIEVIDETAVIETVPASKVGLGCGKEKRFMGLTNHSERSGNKKNMKEEADERKEKRSRRKGKAGKKASGANEKEKILTPIAEARIACEIKSGKAKRAYSKKQMESLRFVDVEAQRKKWMEVYCGLGPSVAREYDSLVECNHQKHIHVNFDPRRQFGKKAEGSGICSEECSQNGDNEIENMNPRDPACGLCVSDLDGCTAVEGECSEDENSDEDYSSIQRPAFFVTGKPNFDSGPPEDGFEYLRRVRWEAAHIPKVKVAKLERKKLDKEQTVYMPEIPDIAKCPEHLLPLKQWEDGFLADFSELRLVLSRYEGSCAKISDKVQSLSIVHDEENSQQLPDSMILENFDNLTSDRVDSCQALDCSVPECLSDPLLLSNADENDTSSSHTPENSSHKSIPDGCSSNSPTLSAILRMDSVARISMLRRRINALMTMSSLSRNDCAWLYALCAAVDTPLDGDTSAALRCLLRKSASLRAEKSELDDEVIMLNILATISGRYFGQSDN